MIIEVKVLLATFVLTILLSFIIIPILKKLKVGQVEREEGPNSHLKKAGTPTMGGMIFAIAIIIVSVIVFIIYHKQGNENNIVALLLVTVGFGLVGFIDDFKKLVLKDTKGLKPSYKMLGLLVISVAFILYLTSIAKIGTEIYIPFFKFYVTFPIWGYIPFAIFVMLGTTNAVNLTDGVDGLSTSVCTIIITCLTVIGLIFKTTEISIFGSIVIGACLGFLLFNLYPAKVFMGDTGSLLLGGVIVSMALYLKLPLLLILIALVPVCETLSVIIQVVHFKRTGNRIFKMSPIHHHFELSGWSENKVASIFSLITLVLCIIGVFAI